MVNYLQTMRNLLPSCIPGTAITQAKIIFFNFKHEGTLMINGDTTAFLHRNVEKSIFCPIEFNLTSKHHYPFCLQMSKPKAKTVKRI
jgi:hypothetical protein